MRAILQRNRKCETLKKKINDDCVHLRNVLYLIVFINAFFLIDPCGLRIQNI